MRRIRILSKKLYISSSLKVMTIINFSIVENLNKSIYTQPILEIINFK
jgi:hypothetical protein